MLDIIPDNTLGRREIADRHFNNPALHIGELAAAPELHVFLHRDILWLPMVILHCLVEIVGPLVFERQDIKEHCVLTIDDLFSGKCLFRFGLVENEGFVTDCVAFFHRFMRLGWVFGLKKLRNLSLKQEAVHAASEGVEGERDNTT